LTGIAVGLVIFAIYEFFLKKILNIAIRKILLALDKYIPSFKKFFLKVMDITARFVYALTFVHSYLSRKLTRSFIGVLVFGAGIILIYFLLWNISGIIVDPTQEYLKKIYTYAQFSHIDEYITLSILSLGPKILPFQLTATLTLFYFIYREQRSVSISNVLNRKNLILWFVISSILTLAFGAHLSKVINQDILQLISDSETNGTKAIITLIYSSNNIGRLFLWALLFLASFLTGVRMIIQTINNLSIKNMLGDTLPHIKKQIRYLKFAVIYSHRKQIFDNLTSSIESLHQLLFISIEKNMDGVFRKSNKEWEAILADLLQSPRFIGFDNTVIIEYLLKHEGEETEKLYTSILKNKVSLIMVLLKNHKIEEAQESIKVFFQLNTSEIKLRFIFLNVLQELALLIYSNDSIGMKPILDGVEALAQDDGGVDQNGINLIYKCLLIKAIEKNDVKMLSSVSYSMFKCVDHFDDKNLTANPTLTMLQLRNGISVAPKQKERTGQFVKCIIFILLQAKLKSIELSHYACTGFLIKFIVTAFRSSLLAETFFTFNQHKFQNNPYLKQREQLAKMNVSFTFNTKTMEYCHKKMTILLLAQQLYVVKEKIDFGEVPKSYIDVRHLKCNYQDYLFKKIELAKSKYGLLFLEEKVKDGEPTFIETVKEYIKKHGSPTN
jgi:hypothetical protein